MNNEVERGEQISKKSRIRSAFFQNLRGGRLPGVNIVLAEKKTEGFYPMNPDNW